MRTVTDADGDAVVQALSVNVDDDMPTLGPAGTLAVDEDDLLVPPASFAGNSDVTGAGDDLADPSPTSVSASLGVSFGADGAGGVTAISYTGPALTSGTVPLAYAFNDATDTLTATAGARTVFTLVVDEVAGTWTFTLLDHLDHPLVSTEDNLVLSFSVWATLNPTIFATSMSSECVGTWTPPYLLSPMSTQITASGVVCR